MFKKPILRRKRYKSQYGAIIAEHTVALYFLFIAFFLPFLDLTAMGLRSFFFWFACDQAAMAGAKGTVWSTNTYANNYYTSMQTQAINAANNIIHIFSGVKLTSGPTFTVIAQAIPNSGGVTQVWAPSTTTFLDTSQYVPILQVSMTGTIDPFIVIPLPSNIFGVNTKIPGFNASYNLTVTSAQQIENATALSY